MKTKADYPLLKSIMNFRLAPCLKTTVLTSVLVVIQVFFGPAVVAETRTLTLLSTTSTENSGLLAALLPQFSADTGIEVKVLAMGTGQAMRAARNGDGDLLLVHDKPSEVAFINAGYGKQRIPIMFNDFVLVGPGADPAQVSNHNEISAAMLALARSQRTFISRADNSGTHKAELRLWQTAGVDPLSLPAKAYREAGAGMGRTLNIAATLDAYTLVDRGTWLSFRNKQNLKILLQGDKRLFNQYSVILLNPAKHPHIHQTEAIQLANWLASEKGQAAIKNFQINGQPLFFPNYRQQASRVQLIAR